METVGVTTGATEGATIDVGVNKAATATKDATHWSCIFNFLHWLCDKQDSLQLPKVEDDDAVSTMELPTDSEVACEVDNSKEGVECNKACPAIEKAIYAKISSNTCDIQ